MTRPARVSVTEIRAADPAVEDLERPRVERHHVGAQARREPPDEVAEAQKLGGMR